VEEHLVKSEMHSGTIEVLPEVGGHELHELLQQIVISTDSQHSSLDSEQERERQRVSEGVNA